MKRPNWKKWVRAHEMRFQAQYRHWTMREKAYFHHDYTLAILKWEEENNIPKPRP